MCTESKRIQIVTCFHEYSILEVGWFEVDMLNVYIQVHKLLVSKIYSSLESKA